MFSDRKEAGKKLAAAVAKFKAERPLVVALPRGGVPVAREVAAALDAPMDVLVVHRMAVPTRPELSLGAVSEDGAVSLDQKTLDLADLSPHEVEREVEAAHVEVRRRASLYRRGRARVPVQGRTVILVDDGIATGQTIRAALEALARAKAGKVVLASPVIGAGTAHALTPLVSELVCLETRPRIHHAYRDLRQLRDDEVVEALDPPGVQA